MTLSLLGCGGEPRFDAQEFAAEANRHKAGIHVGQPLDTGDPRQEIYAVELEPADGKSAAAGTDRSAGTPHEEAGGSLKVTEDDDVARAEFERCEAAGGLLCYRAANVVLVFEPEADPAALRRLGEALRRMGSD